MFIFESITTKSFSYMSRPTVCRMIDPIHCRQENDCGSLGKDLERWDSADGRQVLFIAELLRVEEEEEEEEEQALLEYPRIKR